MKYENFYNNDKSEIEKLLKDNDSQVVISTIIGAVNGIEDWQWVQNQILPLTNHDDFWVAKSAVNALGDIARIHKNLETSIVIEKLSKNKRQDLESVISECISDIRIYLK